MSLCIEKRIDYQSDVFDNRTLLVDILRTFGGNCIRFL